MQSQCAFFFFNRLLPGNRLFYETYTRIANSFSPIYDRDLIFLCVYLLQCPVCCCFCYYCCHCDHHYLLLLPLWQPLPAAASAIVSATTCLPAVAVLLLYDHSVSWNISFFPSQSYIIFLFCLSVCMSVYVCVCALIYFFVSSAWQNSYFFFFFFCYSTLAALLFSVTCRHCCCCCCCCYRYRHRLFRIW